MIAAKLLASAFALLVIAALDGLAHSIVALGAIALAMTTISIALRAAWRGSVKCVRSAMAWARKIDAIFESTHGLKDWRDTVDHRLAAVNDRLDESSRQLDVVNQIERAAVSGALQAVQSPARPRSKRRTDPPADPPAAA